MTWRYRSAVDSSLMRDNNRAGEWSRNRAVLGVQTFQSNDALILAAAVRFAADPDVSRPICEQADAGDHLSEVVYDTLAHEMSITELVLRDAVEDKMGVTRGQWVKFGRS